MSKKRIADILRAELQAAVACHRIAHKRFRDETSNLHRNLLPSPDGALYVRQLGQLEQEALQARFDALDRFTRYALDGAVPEELAVGQRQ